MAKRDIYQEITGKIVRLLDKVDVADFTPPFAALAVQGLPSNPVTDHTYQGINIPVLWIDQQDKAFGSSQWATFKQWQSKGAQVRKGEKGSPIIFYKTLEKVGEDHNGDERQVLVPMLRTYTVFNAAQVDGFDSGQTGISLQSDQVTKTDRAEQFCAATKAEIRHGLARAFYHPADDYIGMPDTAAFRDTPGASATENYYGILLHELTHWTAAPDRLDRPLRARHDGMDQYAFEELIAELGAAFLCAHLGITQSPREDHARYIKSWLAALKSDKAFVFKAAAQASRACDFLQRLQD